MSVVEAKLRPVADIDLSQPADQRASRAMVRPWRLGCPLAANSGRGVAVSSPSRLSSVDRKRLMETGRAGGTGGTERSIIVQPSPRRTALLVGPVRPGGFSREPVDAPDGASNWAGAAFRALNAARGVESRGDLPGSVPSSWLGQALPNARQCGACFYGEVPGSAIAFGFGPELRPTSGRGLERLLDQEWLRLPTACLLRSAGFPDEQLRPPLQLQALRRYSARSVPERRRHAGLGVSRPAQPPASCHA